MCSGEHKLVIFGLNTAIKMRPVADLGIAREELASYNCTPPFHIPPGHSNPLLVMLARKPYRIDLSMAYNIYSSLAIDTPSRAIKVKIASRKLSYSHFIVRVTSHARPPFISPSFAANAVLYEPSRAGPGHLAICQLHAS